MSLSTSISAKNKTNWDSLLRVSQQAGKAHSAVMPPEQMAYYLMGHSIISQQDSFVSEDSRCAYLAIGPDLSTPLLLFNPKEIEGIDVCHWDANKIRQTLNVTSLENASMPSVKSMNARERRYNEGFWNVKDLEALNGWYQPLLHEIISLGIDTRKVEVVQTSPGKIKLHFPWKHPLHNREIERTVVLNSKTKVDCWLSEDNAYPRFNSYLDKGVNISDKKIRSRQDLLSRRMEDRAVFVSSIEKNAALDANGRYATVLESKLYPDIKSRAKELELGGDRSDDIRRILRQQFPLYRWGYGWQLRGYASAASS